MVFGKRGSDNFDSGSPLLKLLLSPYVAIRDWFADAISGDDSLQTGSSGLSSVTSWLTLPFRLLFAFAVFMVQAWSISRSGRAFVLGFPAISTVAMCLIITWASTRYFNVFSVGRTAGYYGLHSQKPNTPPEYALMFARKLVGLKPQDPAALFQLGLALARNEDIPGAVGVMNMLADLDIDTMAEEADAGSSPDDPQTNPDEASPVSIEPTEQKIGDYLPAHLWLSRYYQREIAVDGYNQQADSLAEKHLIRAAQNTPEDTQLAISLASLHELRALNAKDTDAATYLAELKEMEVSLTDAIKPPLSSLQQVAQIPKLIQTKRKLAELDDTLNFEQSKAQFAKLFDQLLKISRKNPDKVRLSIIGQVISGYIQLKEYDKAVNMISEVLPTFDDTEIKRQLVKNAGFVFLESAQNNNDLDDREQYQRRLSSICACLNSSIRERRAYQMLIGIIRHNQFQPEKLDWLQDSLFATPKLSVSHLLIGCQLIHIGTRETDQDKIRRGTSHWKIAYKIEPQSQLMLSNILEIGIADQSSSFENIDAMIREAIKMFPDQSQLHQTSGLLSIRNNDFQSAIASFETAVATDRFPVIAHLLLVYCYETTGDAEKAASHQNNADTIMAKLDVQQKNRIEAHVKNLTGKPTR